MVRITEELIRKRCEHNEGEIGSLEELSLHQENIEKIEHLQNWCRDLKILLFHSNLISKIENVNKLKKLEYLNLSLNNVERIENLERCEFLGKLDLTLNFIGELTSVENLVHNIHLETLYLTGNPCTDYAGYRQFVVATLPQLQYLDGVEIERSERIEALQNLERNRRKIIAEQLKYKGYRSIQRAENELKYQRIKEIEKDGDTNEEELQKFWNEPSDNSPETRVYIAEQTKRRGNTVNPAHDIRPKRVYHLFNKEGHPLNINEAKVPFTFTESEDCFVLNVEVYKFLESSLVEADVQPTYVRVCIKGKTLQMVLPEDVKSDCSIAQRSQITGHLVITMPKVRGVVKPIKKQDKLKQKVTKIESKPYLSSKRELLEIGPPTSQMDFSRIVDINYEAASQHPVEKQPSSGFVEDPDVPPLE